MGACPEETWRDGAMRKLIGAIKDGLIEMTVAEATEGLADFWRH